MNQHILKRDAVGKRLVGFALVMLTAGFASVAGATYSLPDSRSVTWQGNAGVKNDIPSRTTVYKTLNPSGGDDTSAIQTAINGCPSGQVVKLNSGTFNVSSPITVKSNVVLRGAGMGVTTIKGKSGMTGAYVVGISTSSASMGTARSITGGLAKGSTSISTSAAHGWSVGDIILIDQLNQPQGDPTVSNVGNNGTCTWCGRASGTRSLGQMNRVVATPSSTTATLEVPLYWNYDAALSPQGVKYSSIATNAGIESLTVDNSLSGSTSQMDDGGTILIWATADCWLQNVEAIGVWETMVRVFGAYRNTIRGCKFHDGASPAGSSQYGIWLNPYASANLIENNEIYRLTTGILLVGAVSGNVISYNYLTSLNDSTIPSWNLSAIGSHGGHPMMNLIEGNYADGRLRNDNVWGSSSHNTLFRNRQSLSPNKSSAPWDIDLHLHQQYYNIVGNVLGTSGIEYVYELQNVNLSSQKSIFRFGYDGDGDGSASGNDARVYSTVLRHGNWDSVTNGTVWNGADDRALPSSLYLTSKPSWWGSIQWPCIGPDVTPLYPPAPGAGKGTPWRSDKPRLSPPVLVSVQ